MIGGPLNSVKLARKLRSEMSLPEVLLWRELRKRPGGFKFRRQHAAGPFVLDFYCASARLDLEIDGVAHDTAPAVKRDQARSGYLRSRGIATTRVPASLVLEDIEAVVMRVVEICNQRTESAMAPLHHPADGPPPLSGEDL